MNPNDEQEKIEMPSSGENQQPPELERLTPTSPEEQESAILDQWITWRREEMEGLDIRQAVSRELEGSPLSPSPSSDQSEAFRFPIPRIILSSLIRIGAIVGWFLLSA